MKKLPAIVCLFLTVCGLRTAKAAHAATSPDYDKQLAAQLSLMEKEDPWQSQEKISAASDRVKAMLIKWSSQPALMVAPLKKAKAAGLDVLESDNHALRVYNWYTHNGGTMQVNDNVFQYRAGGRVYVRPTSRTQIDDLANYTSVESVRTRDGVTVYLLLSEMIGSNIDYSTAVRAMIIKNKQLVDVKIFKTKTEHLSEINCDVNRDNSKDSRGDLPGIIFEKQSKTIKVPLINKDMSFNEHYLLYKFDGSQFVYRGTGD